jgi:hypothetical protein
MELDVRFGARRALALHVLGGRRLLLPRPQRAAVAGHVRSRLARVRRWASQSRELGSRCRWAQKRRCLPSSHQ